MAADEDRRQQARAALVSKFRASAQERLRRLSRAFLELERRPDKADAQEALRELHTLKGEARLVGLADVAEATHKTEELAFHARKTSFQVSAAVHDALLAGLDLIGALLAQKAEATALAEYGGTVDALVAAPAEPLAERTTPAETARGEERRGGQERRGGDEKAHAGFISVDLERLDPLTNLIGDLVQDETRRERAVTAVVGLVHAWRDELRAALGHIERASAGGAGAPAELAALRTGLGRQVGLERDVRRLVSRLSDASFEERLRLQEAEGRLREVRMTPIAVLFGDYRRGARDLARQLGKAVRVTTAGDAVGVDKRVLDQIAEPLLHLVRNAIDHGLEAPDERRGRGKPEEGLVSLAAEAAGGRLRVTIGDDGAGLAPDVIGRVAVDRGLLTEAERGASTREQIFDVIFKDGFSTRADVSEVSGRGVGLDVVRRRIESLGGTVSVRSERGGGTTFVLDVPLSLSLVEVLLFEERGVTYALPTACLHSVLTVEATPLVSAAGGIVFHLDNEIVPLGDLPSMLGARATAASADGRAARILVLAHRGRKLGVRVTAVVGYRSIVQREPDLFLEGIRLLAGTALLGEGKMALVLEPAELVEAAQTAVHQDTRPTPGAARARSILLVDDSEITRLLLAEIFGRLGYRVREAGDGRQGLDALAVETPDLILLDLDMPVMSGFEFLQRLRAERQGTHVPVVVFSSRGSDEDKRRSVALGADAYLVKARFQESDLVETVQRFLPEAPA